MKIDGWTYYNFAAIPTTFPHENPNMLPVENGSIWKIGGGKPLFARWTTDFDCGYETDFWACILDKPFNLQNLKAKRRYEVNKGNKNFYCKKLSAANLKEMYSVYLESLQGYSGKVTVTSEKNFNEQWSLAFKQSNVLMLGAFEKDTNILCGYAHCIDHGKYIPISTLKARVSSEKKGINFALVSGIVTWFEKNLANGSYLCDGWRNVLHDTNFQEWLEKYFQFRKAYCKLHIQYKKPLNLIVKALYPFRKLFRQKQLKAIFNMDEWSKKSALI